MEIAAQGALTSLYRSDVLANNLANFETDAFKPDLPMLRERAPVRFEDGVTQLPSNALLERLGAGPHLAPNHISFKQGPLDVTGQPLDLAIEGEGFFLVSVGQGNTERLRLSRDGRLTLDERGRLVQAASGHRLLDRAHRPIYISRESGPLTIDADGTIIQGQQPIAQIGLVDLPDRRRLTKEGDNLYVVPPEEQKSLTHAVGTVRQGALEKSSVNEISTLNDLTSALTSVGTNIGMMTYADRMMERAINGLGRVA